MRHFCQLARNWALASSRLGARPLVVMPSMGFTYTDRPEPAQHRQTIPILIEPAHVAAILNDHVIEPVPISRE
jgi:hypothetical protein